MPWPASADLALTWRVTAINQKSELNIEVNYAIASPNNAAMNEDLFPSQCSCRNRRRFQDRPHRTRRGQTVQRGLFMHATKLRLFHKYLAYWGLHADLFPDKSWTICGSPTLAIILLYMVNRTFKLPLKSNWVSEVISFSSGRVTCTSHFAARSDNAEGKGKHTIW